MDSKASILPRLRLQLSSLPALVENLPRDRYDARVDDHWSVTNTIAHLARYHEVVLDRLRRMLSEDDPAFPAYRAELDPEWPAWERQSFEQVVALLHANRDALIDFVERLAPNQWHRTGRHVRFGSLSIRAWLEFFLAHEGHHLYLLFTRARSTG